MFATSGACRCGLATGLATCFGATTVMPGSRLVEPVAVCATAVPFSNTVDRTARAEGATRPDDILITRSPKSGDQCRPRCGHRCCHVSNQHFRRNDRRRFSCPLSRPDTRALPVSILCGDPEFPPIQHAGAVPPGSVSVPAQEHLGFHALRVVPVSECVFAVS